jgi:hypothetical protein
MTNLTTDTAHLVGRPVDEEPNPSACASSPAPAVAGHDNWGNDRTLLDNFCLGEKAVWGAGQLKSLYLIHGRENGLIMRA